ncbi:ribosome-associated translation inhibitor RaiA [Nocardioides sp. TF02-7]|uniref:ribosome hibernation-promoting factor, HPF/YfiA family n=1 Tax=Nocardioides sp. TF02-7 TaxID=2917724 RepID=UPI0031F54BF5
MDVVVTGRHCEISDRFRAHAAEKLTKLEKHDHRIMRVHVEVDYEPNRRQHPHAVHVELTAYSKGPVIRAEAAADDKMSALDLALDKMAAQMRRAADRRRVHRGRRTPVSVGKALAAVPVDGTPADDEATDTGDHVEERQVGPITVTGDGPLVVREKTHHATPMTLDQALYEMELVGHDFYLFVDKESERPSVVYRRKGIRLRRDLPRPRRRRLDLRSRTWARSRSAGSLCDDAAMVSPNEPVRVLVVDDQELFRRGLTMLLGTEPGIEVVGEASDGTEGTDLAIRSAPDVVLLDVRMPKQSGIEACVAIKEALPTTKIVMLTSSDEEADLYEAVKSGASGYLLKDSSIEEVAQGIRVVAEGQSLISPSMAAKLIDEFKTMSKPERASGPALKLTDRELEVLRLVAKGLSNRDVAQRLAISENTVKNHVRNMLEKLQLHSRMEAVMYAVREKLVDLG